MPTCNIASLALSKISRQFNYPQLKLDRYFLTITPQRPDEHMNHLTPKVANRGIFSYMCDMIEIMIKKTLQVKMLAIQSFASTIKTQN